MREEGAKGRTGPWGDAGQSPRRPPCMQAGRAGRNQSPPCMARGLGNGATTVENSLAAPQTVKRELTVNTSNPILCSYAREVTTRVCAKSSPHTSTAAGPPVRVSTSKPAGLLHTAEHRSAIKGPSPNTCYHADSLRTQRSVRSRHRGHAPCDSHCVSGAPDGR